MRCARVRRHPTVIETELVGPEWSLNRAVQETPDLKGNRSELCDALRSRAAFSDLPSPEERIFESIHTGQRKVVQSILGILVPVLPGVPEGAIGVRRDIRRDAPQVETTVVVTVAVLSGESDTELGLARKSRSAFCVQEWEADASIHVVQLALPGRASPPRPDTSHLTIRRWDVDGLSVGLTAKREVSMGVQGESIGIGQQISPGHETADTVANRKERTLAFTDACDVAHHLMDFQVASGDCALARIRRPRIKTATHKDVKVLNPMIPTKGSLTKPNIGMRLLYSGWLMNSAMIRM